MSARPKVLLVDDEPLVLSSLSRVLRREPYEVSTATSGREALDALERDGADLVLADYKMPDMNGIELLKEVRKRHPGAVRILLTAQADPDQLRMALASGLIRRALRKPWNNRELRETLQAALLPAPR